MLILIPSGNTLTDTPLKKMFRQISGHPVIQSSWYIKLTIAACQGHIWRKNAKSGYWLQQRHGKWIALFYCRKEGTRRPEIPLEMSRVSKKHWTDKKRGAVLYRHLPHMLVIKSPSQCLTWRNPAMYESNCFYYCCTDVMITFITSII